FTYLGYEFKYVKQNRDIFYFQYGISAEKLNKYRKKLYTIILDYNKNKNIELLRQRMLFFSSRVVFYNNFSSGASSNATWDVIGLPANYSELRTFISKSRKITPNTLRFLNMEIVALINNEIKPCPYFLINKYDSYLLESRMLKNKSIIFHPNIGWTQEHLIKMIKKLDPLTVVNKKSYRELVKIYCHILKV
ncbi:hypothetical protein, partial [Bacillus wiedmannii]|uniref:hypothetical protein n=1 Tax=Bacillus wiedmannii TaxID=1890302 RepID=UPI0021D2AF7C